MNGRLRDEGEMEMNTRSENSQSVLKSISLAAAFFIGVMSMPAMAAVTVKMTSPAANATATEPGSFVLTATASSTGGSIKNVAFYSGTTLLYTDTTSPYTYTWNNVPAGTYVLKAKATDSKNATATSTTVTVTVTKPVQTYYIDVDHLNSPRAVTNSTGAAVWIWDNVDPFGANTPNGNPGGLGAFEFNLRFPGQYFDKETSVHYNYFRDYDPAVGRYVESDPIGLDGGVNIYIYVANNLLKYIDPNGLAGVLPGPVPIPIPGPVNPPQSKPKPGDPLSPYTEQPSSNFPPSAPPPPGPRPGCRAMFESCMKGANACPTGVKQGVYGICLAAFLACQAMGMGDGGPPGAP